MNTVHYEAYKERLRELLTKMETCTATEGMSILDSFVKSYEDNLYNEIGRLTRQLHDSLTNFDAEEKLLNITNQNIPSAKERLRYVVSVTEQATQNVLNLIEKSIPVSLDLGAKADQLHEKCIKAANQGNRDGDDFLGQAKGFLADAKANAGMLHEHLTEILMAQEYQDITGQIIRKVIDLVQDVEDSLIKLIKMTGMTATVGEKQTNDEFTGPYVPGIDNQQERVSDQDDVDHLLASLGF